ncbi:hypothetical protein ACTXT7_015983 [Hymenolepis weldensis]
MGVTNLTYFIESSMTKQSTPADDKRNQPEEVGLTKPISLANVTVSKSIPDDVSRCNQVWMRYRKNLRSHRAALTFNPKTDPMETYLDSGYNPPPWNFRIFKIQRSHWPDRYFGRLRRPWKKLKMRKVMDKQLLTGSVV